MTRTRITSFWQLVALSVAWVLPIPAIAGCDACLQAAVSQAQAQISSSLTALEQSVGTNVQATQTLNSTIQTANSALTTLMEGQHRILLQSLDAAAVRLEGAQTVQATTIAKVGDHLSQTVRQTMAGVLEAEMVLHHDELYGERSIPITADVNADRAPLLKQALLEYRDQLSQANVAFKQWYFSVEPGDHASTRRRLLVEEKIAALSEHLDGLANQLLDSTQTDALLELFRLVIMPEPQDVSEMSADDALAYRTQYHHLAVNYHTIASYILKRAPLLSTENWATGYVVVNEQAGKTSLNEFLHSETDRKLFAKPWYLNMATRTTPGLLREEAQSLAMSNYLLGELLEQQSGRLAATVTVSP